MERRAFLRGMGSTAVALAAPACSRDAILDARVTVASGETGRSIPGDFTGLSYESSILAPGDYFTPDNDSVLGLIRRLGENGVIRIGGNTSERTVWRSAGTSAAAAEGFAMTPAAIDRLAGAMRSLGWRLIYGLNLARGSPDEAAAEAAYVAQAVGPRLLAFQIGNEPNGFGRWNEARPKGYDFEAYLKDWRLFHAAILGRVPDATFAGPDVIADPDWVAKFAEADLSGLALLTQHYYADGPAGAWHVSLAKLMRSGGQVAPMLERLKSISRKSGLPYRIVEANSIFNEGQHGVSDTLGAAVWGLELMFQIAAADGAGINFHTGADNHHPADDKAYTPIARAAGGRYRATPLYYGMLMFALAARGTLVPAQLLSSHPELNAFATRTGDGTLRVCLINKDMARNARMTVNPGVRFARASILRLAGPAADATTGVTLGGAAVDEFGRWSAKPDAISKLDGEETVVDLTPCSAALVSFHIK